MTYRRFGTRLDRALDRAAARARALARADGRPAFASPLHYLPYIARVALDARRRGVDVVHLHNFAQFAPIVRRLCPGAAAVLHMHCECLSQLEPGETARRLEDDGLRAALGRAGRARAEALFGWDAVAARLRALHEEARARRAREPRRAWRGGRARTQVPAGQAVAG